MMTNYVPLLIAILLGVGVGNPSPGAAEDLTIPLNPRATYLYTFRDPEAVRSVPVPLTRAALEPGDLVTIVTTGTASLCQGCPEAEPLVIGAFTAGGPPSEGALAVGHDIVTDLTYFGSYTTDIAGDFKVEPRTGTTVRIPPGATTLWLAVADTHYSDNSEGPLTITIRKGTP